MKFIRALLSLTLAFACFSIYLLPIAQPTGSFWDSDLKAENTANKEITYITNTDISDKITTLESEFISTVNTSMTDTVKTTANITKSSLTTQKEPMVTTKVTTAITTTKQNPEPITTSKTTALQTSTPQISLTTPRTEQTTTAFPLTSEVVTSSESTKPQTTTSISIELPQTGTAVPNSDKRTPITEEIRGVWVATVYRIDYPSKAELDAKTLKKELNEIVDNAELSGLNTIYFQVRPTGDALYKSSVFPSSHWVTGEQGAPFPDDLDILEYLIEYAHSKDIAVHAWINPYRVTNSKSMKMSNDNPAVLHPEWTFDINGLIYYNPGIPEVTELIAKGAAEIVENYDVDGIMFDDYFYPDADCFHNSNSKKDLDYELYVQYGKDFDSIADWRRNNINMMIKSTFEAIKEIDDSCLFGVSPAGIWNNKSAQFPNGSDTSGRNVYQVIFCDALAWANGKYIDYLSPQIYWSIDSKAAPFKTLAIWWEDMLRPSQTPLVISYNVYDLKASQTKLQVEFARGLENYYGYIFFSYRDIISSDERFDVIIQLGAFNIRKEDE